MYLLNNLGSVEDIRSTLQNIQPLTTAGIRNDLELLNDSLEYEKKNKGRSTVIKLFQAKIFTLKVKLCKYNRTVIQVICTHKNATRYSLQYLDYGAGQWTTPCLLTEKRMNSFFKDASVTRVKRFHQRERKWYMTFNNNFLN